MKTITINTAELSGVALDLEVAAAIGKQPVLWDVCCGNMVGQPAECCLNPFVSVEVDMAKWSPSTDWSQGGPLIEMYEVHVAPMNGRKAPRWIAMTHDVDILAAAPLIAAMRAIVAAKMGDTVDVPAELVEALP